MYPTGFTYWLENSGESYSQKVTVSSKKEAHTLQEQLKGVQQQLAYLHSQVRRLTEFCSPKNTRLCKQNTNSQATDVSRMYHDISSRTYENVPPIVQKQHNLTYTIQRTVSDLLMCSTSPLSSVPLDQSNLGSFDLSHDDTTTSSPSVYISDISNIPALANSWRDGQLNYSIADIVAALHPSPELCPPPNTPESTCNTYMEISDSNIQPCVRRLFPESSTKVERDLFIGCSQEVHSSSEPLHRMSRARHSLRIPSKTEQIPPSDCNKSKPRSKAFLFRRSSTRRSLRTPTQMQQERSKGCKQQVDCSSRRRHSTRHSVTMSSRPPCIGREISIHTEKTKRADTTYQSLNHFEIEQPSSTPVYESIKETSPSNLSVSSDITAFIEVPLCPQAVTRKTKSNKRKSISKELRRFGKNIQKFGARKLKLETLAVL